MLSIALALTIVMLFSCNCVFFLPIASLYLSTIYHNLDVIWQLQQYFLWVQLYTVSYKQTNVLRISCLLIVTVFLYFMFDLILIS